MVKIRFLGACSEVGRSGVLITSEETDDAVLCDYGTKMNGDQNFPDHVSGKSISAIVLSHSHIDHSGGIPIFYISGSVPLYCTELTYKVMEILLHDMLKISSTYLPFERSELYKMRQYARFLKYGQRKRVGKKTWITLFSAGHIPGSASILVEMDDKKILYTGDINTVQTQLLNPIDPTEFPIIDAVIMETTYGTTDHSPRKETENSLVNNVRKIIDNKGINLIAAFGVARSQEISMILTQKENNDSFPIVMDGMARKISKIYAKYPDMFRDPTSYLRSLKAIHLIDQHRRDIERKNTASRSGIIIAPSGMLKGGTARYYAENIIDNENNAITLVSYQADNTPGKILLEQGVYIKNNSEEKNKVKAQVNHYDFSSHAGKSGLIGFLNNLKFIDKKQVFCIHGDQETISIFAKDIKKLGYTVVIPSIGQNFDI